MQEKPFNTSEEAMLMQKLREVLLKEDREALKRLQDTLNDPEQLSVYVSPIIEQRLDDIKKNFHKEFRAAVNDIIDKKIRESQTELLNVIYPTLGKMIRKYIVHQFQLIKDNIDEQVKKTFSYKRLVWRLRSMLFGISDSDYMLSNLNKPVIEEIYVIQRDSGLLFGSASLHQTVDREVIAGMLTAIKSFVEDAFQREKEDLEMIEYGTYKIFLQNFHSYYIAVAMSGSMSTLEKSKLADELLLFAEKELQTYPKEINSELTERISNKLEYYFFKTRNDKESYNSSQDHFLYHD